MWILALIVAAFALLFAMVAIVLVKRSGQEAQQYQQQLKQRIETLENELSAMMDGAFGVASQLQKVESNLKNTVQQQEQLQQRDLGNLPYNDAVRRVSKGADVDELVEHCGLSRSEAELVKMLHQKSSPSDMAEAQKTTSQRMLKSSVDSPSPEGDVDDFQREPTAQATENTSIDESDTPLDVEEPLFSGELGGEDFQQALARAREYHSQPLASSLDDQSASTDSVDTTKEPDEKS